MAKLDRRLCKHRRLSGCDKNIILNIPQQFPREFLRLINFNNVAPQQ